MNTKAAIKQGLDELKVSMNAVRDEKRKAQETADKMQKLLTKARPIAELLPNMVEACGFEKTYCTAYAETRGEDDFREVYVEVSEEGGKERYLMASVDIEDDDGAVKFYANGDDNTYATLEEAVVAMNEGVEK